MADIVSKAKRSYVMSRVRSKDTKPEKLVRSLVHKLGFRFRLHRRDLPGNPDMVLPKYRVVIFVHGCFWHRHKGCKLATTPASNKAYWEPKFRRTVERDKNAIKKLRRLGWRPIVIWECRTRDLQKLGRWIQERLLKWR